MKIRLREKIFLVILALLIVPPLVFFVVEISKNRPKCIIKNINLESGFSLDKGGMVFELSYLGILPIGEARLGNEGIESYRGKEAYHLKGVARTIFLARLFPAQAEVESYIDKGRLHSLRFIQGLIVPDKPKEEKEIIYDQDKNIMVLNNVRRQVLPNTQDPLSAFFYLQHQDFQLGKEFDININTNQKNYSLYLKVIKKEEYVIENRNIDLWIMQGRVGRRDKSPRHSTQIKIWFMDGPAKAPLLIKIMTNVGIFNMRLIRLEG